MANTYSKDDVDRAYAAGVANAEKLWRTYLISMLDEGALKVRCFECQKCGERYRIDPDVQYPRVVLCPRCTSAASGAIGICQKVDRVVTVSQYQVDNMRQAINAIIDPLMTLQAVFHSSPAAKGLTVDQARQLPAYQRFQQTLEFARKLKDSGWDVNKIVDSLPVDDATEKKVSLERYDHIKEADCV